MSRPDPAFCDLRQKLGPLGRVRVPAEAEEPVLSPAVRAWLFAWMAEIRAGDELAEFGLKARTTAVLHGPPGCGKTTLAHHLSARLGLPLVIVGPEALMSPYLGESEQNMGKLFDALRQAATPCILFLDELEAVGRKRGDGKSDGGARANMLTVMLRRIEEFEGYLIGATNLADSLDPALWRRFHMQLAIELPGPDERFAILRRYALPFGMQDEDLDVLVDLTAGASPALLRNLMEGVKRALVIYPRINRPVATAADVFPGVLASVQPPAGPGSAGALGGRARVDGGAVGDHVAAGSGRCGRRQGGLTRSKAATDLANAVQAVLAGQRSGVAFDALSMVLAVCAVSMSPDRDEACSLVDDVATQARLNVRQGWLAIRAQLDAPVGRA